MNQKVDNNKNLQVVEPQNFRNIFKEHPDYLFCRVDS